MKKLLLIPTAIFPYIFCIGGYLILQFGLSDYFVAIWGCFLLICAVLAIAFNIAFIVCSRKQQPTELLKTALILKLIHIPTYVLIYILGFFMGLMFFMTFPLILFLVFVDGVTLVLSSIISVYALIKNLKNNATISILSILCQIIFCVDVIALTIVFFATKRQITTEQNLKID